MAEEIIRYMREQDLEDVHNINLNSFTTDAWSFDALKREFKLPYSKRFVMEIDGEIVAYIIYWVIRDEATIMTFAVKPDFRGTGVGKRLFWESAKLLNGKVKDIVLDVRKSNIRAIRLYKSLGFTVVYERERFYSDGENALFMCLSLDKIRTHAGDKGKETVPSD